MSRIRALLRRTSIVAVALLGSAATADLPAGDHVQIVGGIALYLGVVPAEVITGHPPRHGERLMHGGVPGRAHRHHVMVAVFDETSGARIGEAAVRARVSEPGQAVQDKALEPMRIDGRLTYGDYFAMSGRGPYRIRVSVTPPGSPRDYVAEFEYRHVPP